MFMKSADYKLNTWYPLTEDEYWVDYDYQDEFPNCQTIVCDTKNIDDVKHCIMTYHNCTIGWSTMAKSETWKFMIVEKPKMEDNIEKNYFYERVD